VAQLELSKQGKLFSADSGNENEEHFILDPTLLTIRDAKVGQVIYAFMYILPAC
jgi:hypothetical protein